VAAAHAPQAGLGVAVESIAGARAIEVAHRTRKHTYVGGREIESLRPGGGHDVHRIAREEQLAVVHGRGDEGSQPRDVTLEDLALVDLASVFVPHAIVQLVPEPGV
jgi:hypothetical protein